MVSYPPHLDPAALLEVAGVLVVHLDGAGRVVWVNPAFESLTGWPLAEIRGWEWLSSLVPEADQGGFAQAFDDARTRAVRAGSVGGVLARGGGELQVEWRHEHLESGEGITVVCVGVDVTSRVRTEQALRMRKAELRSTESRLSDAQRIAKVGCWELELSNGEVSWSDEVFSIFEIDRSRSAASHRAFLDLVHPDDRASVHAAHEASLKERAPYEIVHRLKMVDGRVKWVHERCETVYDGAGRPVRSMGTVQDVTRTVTAEQAAAVKTAAIESSLNAIAFIDLQGRITYVNASFVRIWGARAATDLLGRRASELWESRAGDEATALPPAAGAWTGEVRATTVGGATLVLQASIHLVREPLGYPSTVMASFIDLTERVEFERQLASELSEKEVLLREIHHRVKNNLQIISSLLHFESKRSGTRDASQTFADLRKRLLAMTLVHEKLYQSRKLSLVDFGEYVRSLVRGIATSFEREREIGFRVEADPVALPIELALPAGMIVCELVTNVYKYAHPVGQRGSGEVRISTDASHVLLEVHDDGVGFPDGFGLGDGRCFGLELVRSLTAQLGGEVLVESRNGVHVRVTFPFRIRHTEPPGRRVA